MTKQIRLSYQSRCSQCGSYLTRGTPAAWNPQTKEVRHLDGHRAICESNKGTVPAPVAKATRGYDNTRPCPRCQTYCDGDC